MLPKMCSKFTPKAHIFFQAGVDRDDREDGEGRDGDGRGGRARPEAQPHHDELHLGQEHRRRDHGARPGRGHR